MEAPTETPPDTQINGPDSPNNDTSHLSDRDDLDVDLQSPSAATEQTLVILQREGDVVADLTKLVDEISRERDSLRDKVDEFEASLKEKENELAKELDVELRKTEELKSEVEVSRERIQKLETEIKERNGLVLDLLQVSKETLKRIMESVDVDEEEKAESTSVGEEEEEDEDEIAETRRVAREAEEKVREYKEKRRKEKRELEKSVVSLTEENRDINSLLRAALVEKEAVEKSLSKLKGNNSNEQKRVALLQIAERGLLRVGFGFMMGTTGTTTTTSSSSSGEQQTQTSSDTSECEEEEINISLASTVERIMKNLRQEITQLRRSLEESRSDTERLQSLTEKQSQKITEYTLYIKELEDRERVLAHNVEEFLMEIKETEAEVARWREACELEVEAGKNEIGERDKVVDILKQELEKTRAALDISNGKLKLKEELAATAMAAQAAAERSLQLADSRAAGLRERIEELTRQLEEAESREWSSRKIRHICWPWLGLKVNSANTATGRVGNVRRTLPEMQAFLHYVP